MTSIAKTLISLALVGMTVAACGGGGNSTTTVNAVTIGDQLASLEKAYAEGLVSDKEYKQQREKILDGK
ncbi:MULTISPECIES: SHOCT domain-containing protein [unclassified Shimia]|uniref:SHOCT domain-containing protein n=1 Tax=unclassified Shimia TaxID=2630038 RepID=UPI001ADCEA3E|nr:MULTISPECIES: SHOCT domain-containing protein [unclassified Shimia]MBO9475619.1 SHOCT domain-containing protein [Shimia sp. R10_1]MDA5558354.1 SHOCT domain-containing protein [Shimia sp. MMG029]